VLAPIGNIILMDKAAVFIDNGYFKRVLRATSAQGINLEAFSKWLCSRVNAEWYRTYFYDCMPHQSNPPTDQERQMFSRMNRFIYSIGKLPRFQVRMGRLIRLPDGHFKQKGVDIQLTIDLLRLSLRRDIQKAILVACDSDFVPAVQEARNEGVLVFACFSRAGGCGIHDELHTNCDDRIELKAESFNEMKFLPDGR